MTHDDLAHNSSHLPQEGHNNVSYSKSRATEHINLILPLHLFLPELTIYSSHSKAAVDWCTRTLAFSLDWWIFDLQQSPVKKTFSVRCHCLDGSTCDHSCSLTWEERSSMKGRGRHHWHYKQLCSFLFTKQDNKQRWWANIEGRCAWTWTLDVYMYRLEYIMHSNFQFFWIENEVKTCSCKLGNKCVGCDVLSPYPSACILHVTICIVWISVPHVHMLFHCDLGEWTSLAYASRMHLKR